MKRALLVFVAFFVYSVVMDVRRDSAPYSNAHEKQFVSGCKHAGASEPSCRCSFEWMKAHVPAADFKAYIHDTNTPGYSPSQAPPWVYQAGQTCDVHT